MDIVSLSSVIPFTNVLIDPSGLLANKYFIPFINLFNINSNEQIIKPIIFIFISAAILAGLFRIVYIWFTQKLSAVIGNDLSYKAYKNILLQPYITHINWNSNNLITSITEKTDKTVITFYTFFVGISSLFLTTLILLFLFITNLKLALSCLIVFSISYFLIIFCTKKRLYRNSKLINYGIEKRHQIQQESFGSIRDIILDGSHDTYLNSFKNADYRTRIADADSLFITSSPRSILECVGLTFIALLSIILINKENNPSDLIPLLAVLALGIQKLLPAVQQIYIGYSTIKANYFLINEVLKYVELKTENQKSFSKKLVPFVPDKIQLKSISYNYSSTKKSTLNNIDLNIEKGERIGIIGPSGSGKSTLMDIILGLLKPSSGNFLVNGIDIHSTKSKEYARKWRKTVAHVPQTIFLSDGSIKENIAIGVPLELIDKEKLINAAKQSQIEEFIDNQPQGFNTFVGERGIRLSGGQRQRIGLARAIYKNAKVLILDEATSALDSAIESKIIDSIKKLSKDITVIMVAHRLSTLTSCDRIMELSNGELKELGTEALKKLKIK
tara:strand:- start:41 stop:1714 length:1674 start_codon:yes stop_codon:yes gene_type:complete